MAGRPRLDQDDSFGEAFSACADRLAQRLLGSAFWHLIVVCKFSFRVAFSFSGSTNESYSRRPLKLLSGGGTFPSFLLPFFPMIYGQHTRSWTENFSVSFLCFNVVAPTPHVLFPDACCPPPCCPSASRSGSAA